MGGEGGGLINFPLLKRGALIREGEGASYRIYGSSWFGDLSLRVKYSEILVA